MSSNPFAALDEDAPRAPVASASKPTGASKPSSGSKASAPAKGNAGNGSKPAKATREFEGEVIGAEGGKSFHARGGRGDHKGHSRSARRGRGESGEGRQRSRREFDRRDASGRGHDGHRGGAGKGNWGKAGDELADVNVVAPDESETEPEAAENSNMLSFAQAEALKAEKRAALASQWKKPEAKVLDGSALDGLKLVTNESGEDDGLDFGATGVKSKRERTKNSAAKQTLDVSFRVAPAQTDEREDRGDRGGRGGRGGRGSRDSGRGRGESKGRGGRGANIKIEDTSAFPTLGGK